MDRRQSGLRTRYCAWAALACLFLLGSLAGADQSSGLTQAKNGLVVAVSPPAADVGVEILQKGGNAVDAAVATALAEAVTWPEAGNIGGGGFMLIFPPGKPPVVIEYREKAPAAATVDMFTKRFSRRSALVAGVPGTVAGMALAHQKFGKLPWQEVVAPAVKLAEKGFKMDRALVRSLNQAISSARADSGFTAAYGKKKGTESWKEGDTLVLPDLAWTLKQIQERGKDGFYTGPVADKIEAEMKSSGGIISKADLAAYEAKERVPIHGTYRGYDVYAPSPPSAGGITIVEMLNILENFDLAKNPRFSPQTLHLMLEAMRRAYRDRARYLGDPDFVSVPVDMLTSKSYARELAAGISLAKATRSDTLAKDIPLAGESDETTHFSVIDKDGMAVANTYTLENSFGCGVVVRGAGFLLNNEMTDFNTRPGVTTRTGGVGTEANLIAPGKRMLSSQTPTIVSRDGRVLLITGSPGSRTIPNTVLSILVDLLDYKMDARAAVDAPRIHHSWFPDSFTFEDGAKHKEAMEELKKLGHRFASSRRQGDAHTIAVDPKTGLYYGAADKRRDGKAAGY